MFEEKTTLSVEVSPEPEGKVCTQFHIEGRGGDLIMCANMLCVQLLGSINNPKNRVIASTIIKNAMDRYLEDGTTPMEPAEI